MEMFDYETISLRKDVSLYHHSQAKDSCGFGLIAQLNGRKSQKLIKTSIEALTRMTHRGVVNQDGITGDGCGITIQLSESFFYPLAESFGLKMNSELAVGQIFLNPDELKAGKARDILEKELVKETLTILGWRRVPVNESYCGKQAKQSLPRIEQIFIKAPVGWSKDDLERRLFMARRRAADKIRDNHYYVCSLSCKIIVYKGLVIPKNLSAFYKDLADENMQSAICLFHQRFSTNTAPVWKYAQPFRYIAHNGEINTINANRTWAKARQHVLYTPLIPDLPQLSHLVNQQGSDSSSLDNMLEILLIGGMDIFRALRLLLPPAWKKRRNMDSDLRAFYEFNSMHMEAWDGPAGIVMTNGQQIACTLDRNGLRPARYVITKDNVLTVASEVGVWDYKEQDVIEKGRVGPGEMLAANTTTGEIWRTNKIDDMLKNRQPYRQWLQENTIRLQSNRKLEREGATNYISTDMKRIGIYHKLFNLTCEEKDTVIKVLADKSQEATGSMGDDTPLAVLSAKHRNLFDYFRQQFAQVTNPPIDPLREKSVMSLETCIGKEHNLFQETNGLAYRAIISQPIINFAKLQQIKGLNQKYYKFERLSLNYPVYETLEQAIGNLCDKAVELVKQGCVVLKLTDRDIDQTTVPIHAALAVGAVNSRMIEEGLRLKVNIVIETATVRDSHHFAVLIALGATAIYPYLAMQTINQLHINGELQNGLIEARENYFSGLKKGLLKIMSKMGISTVSSYRNSGLFEIIGLHQTVMDLCFSKVHSRISGATFDDLHSDSLLHHKRAWSALVDMPQSGLYKYVHDGEYHAYNPDVVILLQQAVNSGRQEDYSKFADAVNSRPVASLRDLLKLKESDVALDIGSVESKENILKRFDSAAMSIGALSSEAHESLAIAMNTIGARSNSGEGGEDSKRFNTNRNSKIKQVASGRFGVNAHYLVNAEVIQIKIAQGAKPGEGGQLPGNKVSVEIAKLRNAIPGTTLISPPPHHDIYSIEDLSQLIFDLKQVNPQAMVSVKLVSGVGVGTIAAGVAKAYADMITIAGHDGGTGASPLTSVKYAGNPWELGLAEAHQALIENNLRDKICLQVDGGLKTGLDVIKATILGADSFGFGTGPMVALGCKYLRICHLNNCATGIATQNKTLREKYFAGLPEKVIRYFEFVACEVRHWLSILAVESLDKLIGRTDLLTVISGETSKQSHLDLTSVLRAAKRPESQQNHYRGILNHPFDKGELNQKIISDFQLQNESGKHKQSYFIKNHDRSVGAGISGYLAKHHNDEEYAINLNFNGTAGQSFGVWNAAGVNLNLTGDANDYVGKGMSGGRIVIKPAENIQYVASRSSIIGNTCLYGATGGELFAVGQAGERFAVRNSGATAVVEGVGDHGCEYMTGGTVVILGPVGNNFAAGMTGGIVYAFDDFDTLSGQLNPDSAEVCKITEDGCENHQKLLKQLIGRHFELTNSRWAEKILDNFENYLDSFNVVRPKIQQQLKIEEKVSLAIGSSL